MADDGSAAMPSHAGHRNHSALAAVRRLGKESPKPKTPKIQDAGGEMQIDSTYESIQDAAIAAEFADAQTLKPRILQESTDSILFELDQGELPVVGEFALTLRKGSATLLGATIKAGKDPIIVRVPFCGPPAVLNVSDGTLLELKSVKRKAGFVASWEKRDMILGKSALGGRSFVCLLSSQDLSLVGGLSQYHSDALGSLCEEARASVPKIVVISTNERAKFIVQTLLNTTVSAHGTVSLLSLDPARPEFFTPTNLSVTNHEQPLFETPLFDPVPKSGIVKVQNFGFHNIEDHPLEYRQYTLDLLSQTAAGPVVASLPQPKSTIGMECLASIVSELDPTMIVFEDEDLISSLSAYAKALRPLRFSSSTRYPLTARDVRDVQMAAMFHCTVEKAHLSRQLSSAVSYNVLAESTYTLLLSSTLPTASLPLALVGTVAALVLYPKQLLPAEHFNLPSSTALDPRFCKWAGMVIIHRFCENPRSWSVTVDSGCSERVRHAKIDNPDYAPIFVRGSAEPWWEWETWFANTP